MKSARFDGQPYFSMKFVAGTTLAKRLAEGPLPAREAAEILAPFAARLILPTARDYCIAI